MSLLYTASFKEFGSLVCLWYDVKLRKTQLEVRSLNVTWRRDLWCRRVIVFFWKCVKLLAEQLWQIWRRYHFFAICEKKKLRGLISAPPPPGRAREGNVALLIGSLLTGLSNCSTLVQLTALNRWLALPCPDLTVWRCLAAGASSWQASALSAAVCRVGGRHVLAAACGAICSLAVRSGHSSGMCGASAVTAVFGVCVGRLVIIMFVSITPIFGY